MPLNFIIFIYSSLQKEKQAAIKVNEDSSRCKRLLPTTIPSPDRSPQTRKGHKKSDDNSIAVKFSNNISEIWLSMMLFNSEITMILVLIEDNSKLSDDCKHCTNHAFAKACRPKWPSHLSHEANCLQLFLAQV